MDSARLERLSELFDAALEQETPVRAAFLERECDGDDQLRAEVDALLNAHLSDPTQRFLSPIDWKSGSVDGDTGDDPFLGERVGSYEIIERIGTGGMGAVYKAARVDDYEKMVAIKLVKRGTDSEELVRRFKTETQVMASLGDHPNIARLLDAGTVADGAPYFVMEYVEGTWITRHCDAQKLSIRDRLILFRSVCAAVQFAHRHAVIHRDLKPSNVLITADGTAKLIDFGIAKLLPTPGSEAQAVHTQTEYRVMTPHYASPEQMRGEPVSTASDIYSLGVLLYELLTGSRPYELSSQNPLQWPQIVCEEQPKKPSALVATSVSGRSADSTGNNESVAATAAARGESPRQLRRRLAGDLDNIVLMALRKEPERRYASAEQFAADIARYLDGRPVRARRDTFGYRTAKFIKRNKIAAAIMALLLISIGGGISGIVWQWRNTVAAERERVVAQTSGLLSASPDAVPVIIENLRPFFDEVEPKLRALLADESQTDAARLRISLALVESDPSQVDYLNGRMLNSDPAELTIVREALLPHRDELAESLWEIVENEATPDDRRLRAAAALAAFEPDSKRWSGVSVAVTDALVAESPFLVGAWSGLLKGASEPLIEPLAAIFRDKERTETERLLATRVLADYAADEPQQLAKFVMDAEPVQFPLLFAKLNRDSDAAIAAFEAELNEETPEKATEAEKDALAVRQANAAVALVLLDRAERVWPLLAHSPDPRLRSFLIHRFATSGVDAQLLVERYRAESDVSIRRALLLALGEYDFASALDDQAKPFVDELWDVFRNDPDPGVHGAAFWLLRQCGEVDSATNVAAEKTSESNRPERRWYQNSENQTMVIIPGPVTFNMGSLGGEPGRNVDEFYHNTKIDHSFAIAATEVTVDGFKRYLKDHPGMTEPFLRRNAPEPECAQVSVTWYEAAKYCRWLSEREGIAEDQMCYPPVDEIKQGMQVDADYLTKSGYRLPLEVEWEYACRAGAVTPRYYGFSRELLGEYAWFLRNAEDHTWPVATKKPNDFGLFDMHGNAWEWCHEEYVYIPVAAGRKGTDLKPLEDQGGRSVRGGSYGDLPILVRSGDRNMYRPSGGLIVFGFRVARTVPTE